MIYYICRMQTANKNTQDLRMPAQIFSPSIFHEIVRAGNFELFEKKTTHYLHDNSYPAKREVIGALYKDLQDNYRCEYIYKNKLLINIIKKYGLQKSSALSEFRIGTSKRFSLKSKVGQSKKKIWLNS